MLFTGRRLSRIYMSNWPSGLVSKPSREEAKVGLKGRARASPHPCRRFLFLYDRMRGDAIGQPGLSTERLRQGRRTPLIRVIRDSVSSHHEDPSHTVNTTAHVVFSLALIGRSRWMMAGFAILLGALLPDLAMFAFYGWQKFVLGTPEQVIWSQAYFDPAWQDFFDVFNSIPLVLLIGLIGWRLKSVFLEALCLSMLLHCILDLLMHHDDGHRHFFPISDWRFESPVSYWDPAHFGQYVLVVEAILVVVAAVVLWRSARPRQVRAVALSFAALHACFVVFAAVHWGGLLD